MLMEMATAVDPRPDRVPEQDLLNPPKLVGDGGGALLRIWENPSRVRVFSTGMIYRPKDVARGSSRGRDHPRPRPPSLPRVGPATRLWVPPRVALLAPVLISSKKISVNFCPIPIIFPEVNFCNKNMTKTGNWQ